METLDQILREEESKIQNVELNIIGTDSWDTTSLNFERVGKLLNKRSYVVIPAPSNKEELHFGLNFTEYFSTLRPMDDRNRLEYEFRNFRTINHVESIATNFHATSYVYIRRCLSRLK